MPGKGWWALVLAIGLAIAVRAVVLVRSPEGVRVDFATYYNAGARFAAGEYENLYDPESAVDGRRPLDWPRVHRYAGFPLSAALFTPLGLLGPEAALPVFKATCAAAFIAAMFVLYAGFLRRGDAVWRSPAGLAIAGAVGLLYEPAWLTLRNGGQATALATLCFALFAYFYVDRRAVVAALFLVAAVFLKPLFALGGVVFLVSRDWRFVRPAVLWGLALVLASVILLGWHTQVEWFRTAALLGGTRTVSWKANASVPGLFIDYWAALGTNRVGIFASTPSPRRHLPAGMSMVVGLYHLALMAGFVVLSLRVRSGTGPLRLKRQQLVTLALLLPLLWGTVIWRHYLLFLLVPLTFLAARWSRLPFGMRLGMGLFLLATFAASNRLTDFVGRLFYVNTPWEAAAVALYASASMLVVLALVVRYRRGIVYFPVRPAMRVRRVRSSVERVA